MKTKHLTHAMLLLSSFSLLLNGCSSSPAVSSASPQSTSQPAEEETSDIIPSLTVSNTWDSDNIHYQQISLQIENSSDKDIKIWQMQLKGPDNSTLSQNWNCSVSDIWSIAPAEYNAEIKTGSSVKDIGLIIGSKSTDAFTIASTDVTFIDGTSETIEGTPKKAAETPVPAASSSSVTVNPVGALHVDGSHLVNQQGETVQLKGISTHGLAWYPQFVNKEAFQSLKEDWGVNTIRLAMYTAESGGYCTDGDQAKLKELIDTGVKAANDLGMYVIIDWHILSDGNPTQNQAAAEAFFDEMSAKYSNYDNVLYELCNEPQNSPWSTVIKPYAEDILNIIRKNDPDAVAIVGTNTWSQDVDEVIGSQLDDTNVMYSLHFYAGTHKEDLRNKALKAVQAGVPLFVSECSICDASGNGGIDYDSAQAWLDLLNQNSISYIAWSLSNKNETSALIQSSCDKTSGWNQNDLSETGQWFYHAIHGN
jgi:endoglucanase